jgi:hypothetical protein
MTATSYERKSVLDFWNAFSKDTEWDSAPSPNMQNETVHLHQICRMRPCTFNKYAEWDSAPSTNMQNETVYFHKTCSMKTCTFAEYMERGKSSNIFLLGIFAV